MSRIELSAQAEIRLHEITEYYLAHESVERTLKVINSFNEVFLKISAQPYNYRKYKSS
jgi:plasmid stabilization system protein ParE